MRHETQTAVVDLIEEIFQGVETRLTQEVAAAQVQIDEEAKDKEAKEAQRQTLEDRTTKQLEETIELQAAHAACTSSAKLAEASLAASQKDQASSAALVQAASGSKQKCETTTTENLRRVLEGEWEEVSEAKRLCAELVDAGKELSFDQSLLQGMPAAAEKKPGDRGGFDNMLLEQYQKHLADAIAQLTERMASADTIAAEHSA